jgi:hypothetical protein
MAMLSFALEHYEDCFGGNEEGRCVFEVAEENAGNRSNS